MLTSLECLEGVFEETFAVKYLRAGNEGIGY